MIKRGNPNWCLNGCVDYYNLGKTEGILRACDYIMDEPQNSGLTVFFLDKNRYEYQFMWLKCEFGLPMIICRAPKHTWNTGTRLIWNRSWKFPYLTSFSSKTKKIVEKVFMLAPPLTYPENSWLFLKQNKENICKSIGSKHFKPDCLVTKKVQKYPDLSK